MANGQTTNGWKSAPDQWNLVTFRLHQQTYALPIESIEQIILMVTTIPVPQANDAVEGVINVRSRAVPLVNLGHHFDQSKVPLQLHTPIILAQIKGRMVGLIVDEVIDVLSLTAEQIARPADVLPEELGEVPILQGLACISGSMVPLLNPEYIFLPDQVQVLAQIVEALAEEMSKESFPSQEVGV
jgi:purine-binding chemotaxis protein CheW